MNSRQSGGWEGKVVWCHRRGTQQGQAAFASGETDSREEGQFFPGKTKQDTTGISSFPGSHSQAVARTFFWASGLESHRRLLMAERPVSGSESPFPLTVHKAIPAFPNGRCYLHFTDPEARCTEMPGLPPPAPPTLGGHRVRQRRHGPGLLLPNLSFISQTVLPLGVFWRGSCF